MNQLNGFDKFIPYSTVRIVGKLNGNMLSTGTGFYYLFHNTLVNDDKTLNEKGTATLGIVTNKHVLEGIDEIEFCYSYSKAYEADSEVFSGSTNFKLSDSIIYMHPEDVDLCVIIANKLINLLGIVNYYLKFNPLNFTYRLSEEELQKLDTINDLLMVGYPNGYWDEINNLPIIRKGVNATPLYQNYKGKREFLVDMSVFPGSSGSPLFLVNKEFFYQNNQLMFKKHFALVGILSSGYFNQHKQGDGSNISVPFDLGIAIKASELDAIEKLIELPQ